MVFTPSPKAFLFVLTKRNKKESQFSPKTAINTVFLSQILKIYPKIK